MFSSIVKRGFTTTCIIHDDALVYHSEEYVNVRHTFASKQNERAASILPADSPMMNIEGYNGQRAYWDSFTGGCCISI